MFGIIAIGLTIFIFLAVLLFLGQFYGGTWETVAQGVSKFVLIIVVFAYAIYALVAILRRR